MIELVELELAPFRDRASNRIRAHGPGLTIPTQQAVSASLVLHELATIAAKHGSPSNTEGSVQLDWTAEQEGDGHYLLLEWTETGGPRDKAPVRRRFVCDLIDRCLGPSSSVVKYDPAGLAAQFRIRL